MPPVQLECRRVVAAAGSVVVVGGGGGVSDETRDGTRLRSERATIPFRM